ncbi:MAG: response regulator, partial [Natronospirillum sp.]
MDLQNDLTHVLVVDDDREITRLIETYLTRNQLAVSTAHNGEQMLDRLQKHSIDLIVLDIMMPGDDGFTLCKKVRASSDIPIIMLTAGSDETDRIIGLELGADDYMTKPFNPRELLARIKAVLRRVADRSAPTSQPGTAVAQQIRFGVWTLDVQHRQLQHDRGDAIPLNGADYDLLQIFIAHPSEIISRESLFQRLKGRELSPYDRSIDVQISRLRHK